MGIMHSEYRDRINHWIRTLKEDFYTPAGTLDWEVFKTMEQMRGWNPAIPGEIPTNMPGSARNSRYRKRLPERELY